MKSRLNLLFFACLISIISFISCERDDICPPTTLTTPKLVIEFFDVEDSTENKEVVDLSYIPGDSNDTISLGRTDSIVLPLNTNENTSRFKLIRNTESEDFENVDEVEFIYEVNDEYINRACGFRAVFTDLSATRIPENPPINNWIRSLNVINPPDVINEQVTHVFILH